MCLWLSGSSFFSQGKVILYAWPSEQSHLQETKYTFMHLHIIRRWLLFYFIYRSLTTKYSDWQNSSNNKQSAAMFVFIHLFTSILAEKSSSKLRFYVKEFDN